MAASSRVSAIGARVSSAASRRRSARSVSACELTETYSPAAIDSAPPTSAAVPAISTAPAVAPGAAATPTIRLETEMIPSLAPSTAARSQPVRWTR